MEKQKATGKKEKTQARRTLPGVLLALTYHFCLLPFAFCLSSLDWTPNG